jgi:hypothetical protein
MIVEVADRRDDALESAGRCGAEAFAYLMEDPRTAAALFRAAARFCERCGEDGGRGEIIRLPSSPLARGGGFVNLSGADARAMVNW